MGRHSKPRERPAASDRALLVAVVALVGAVVVASIAVVVLVGTGGDEPVTTVAPPATSTGTPGTPTPSATAPAVAETPAVTAPPPAATTPPAKPSTSAPASPAKPPPTVVLKTTDRVWIRVSDGKKILISGTYPKGKTLTFNQPALSVRIGNAGSVRSYVNGKRRKGAPAGQIDQFTARRG
jgi:cytoskeleton protein RodZ